MLALAAPYSVMAFEQVEKLKVCLEEARRRLGAQSRSLQQQWRRGITVGDTVRLLGDINSISDAPQRVQKLEEAKACCLRFSGCSLYCETLHCIPALMQKSKISWWYIV